MKTAVILAFDRLALRMLGCYGNIEHPTPHLDRFAADSIVFDQHFTTDVGQYAARPWQTIDVTRLHNAAVETQAVIEQGCRVAPPTNGFASRWELLPGNDTPGKFRGSLGVIRAGTQTVQSWSRHHTTPRLLWLHAAGFDNVEIADGDSPSSLRQHYREWLGAIDDAFGELSSAIAEYQRATGNDLLVIVVADEGADLGEVDGIPEPFRTPREFQRLSEAVIHTPLIIHATNSEMGTRRHSLVQITDLWPTVCEWFDPAMKISDKDGRNLWPFIHDDSDVGEREFVCLADGDKAAGLRTREWLLQTTAEGIAAPPRPLDPAVVRLFVKPDDLWDVHNVTEQNPAEAERLLQLLREHHGQR